MTAELRIAQQQKILLWWKVKLSHGSLGMQIENRRVDWPADKVRKGAKL